ncbi:MAG: ABC transporter ATP-binding protein [Rhizobiales bacterium]|nr:ABC transporter ATP-binding protein [Hyphomicrobiales bacterium]
MSDPSPLLAVENLSVRFVSKGILPFTAKKSHTAVSDVSFSVGRSEIVGLVGESGSGKSTLGRALLRLIKPAEGTIRLDGTDVWARHSPAEERGLRDHLQFVFQDPYSSLNPHLTLGASVAEPLVVKGGTSRRAIEGRVREVFEMVRLPQSFIHRHPSQVSGGQRQRAAIARALTTKPSLIVADEPTSALDVSIQADIVNLFMDMRDNLGVSFLFITHDLAVSKKVCDRILVLFRGRVVESGRPDDLFRRPAHPYTRTIIESLPSADFRHRSRVDGAAAGTESEAGAEACVFHARCRKRVALGDPSDCAAQTPALQAIGPRHFAACHHPDLEA